MSLLNVSNTLPVDTSNASAAFLILGAAAVFIMTPGLGFFYSGMARNKNSLSLVMLSFLSMAIVTIQWFIWGFSLSYSQYGTPFIGSWDYMGFSGVNQYAVVLTNPNVSSITFALYQLMFAAVTPAIIFGAVAERVRMLPSMVFIFCWSTLVFDVAAYWTWAARGWIRNLSCLGLAADLNAIPCQIGGYDYAGGGPVHIASGFAGLAFCIFLGRRRNVDKHTPSSLNTMMLGTALLW
jgi:Amt family ammonium transporter